jgi:hypothetical protein
MVKGRPIRNERVIDVFVIWESKEQVVICNEELN